MIKEIKQRTKELICKRLNISYNRFGMPNVLATHLVKSRDIVMVDIGAHNGDFTNMVEKYCGISKGILVEALPDKASQLRTQFVPPRYVVFECAASSESGTTEFEVNEAKATSSMFSIKRDMTELSDVNLGQRTVIECKTRTLDDMAAEAKLETIDLIKLDVQGAEHLVLKGALKTLRNTSMVWTETSFKPLYDKSSDFTALYNQFYSLGFKLMEIEPGFRGPDGELLQCDALFFKVRIVE